MLTSSKFSKILSQVYQCVVRCNRKIWLLLQPSNWPLAVAIRPTESLRSSIKGRNWHLPRGHTLQRLPLWPAGLTSTGTSDSKQQPRSHPGCDQVRSFCPTLGHISTLQWIPQTDFPLLPHRCQTWVYCFVQSPAGQKRRQAYRCKDLQNSTPRVPDLLQNHGGGQAEFYLKYYERTSVSIFCFH